MPRLARAFALVALALPLSLPLPAAAETRVPASEMQVQLSFAPVVALAAPSVVNIYATRMVREASPFFEDPFFSQFFRDFAAPRPKAENSLGSGVIVADGLVVSNFHVVENATDIRIVLSDRREYDGTLVLADEAADLAVIRLDGAGVADLPALSFAASDAVEVGDLVLAIGNPFGLGQTVSSGIVSGLARSGRGGGAFNSGQYFIQTDAPINPGNSGGALVDMAGRLVGINTQIVTRTGGSNGIGFAVPADLVARVVAQAQGGAASFTRPWAGVEVQAVDADMADALGFARPRGLILRTLADASPFRDAGLQPGDVLLSFAGVPVDAPAELLFRLSLQELGSRVAVTYQRGDSERRASVEMRAAASAAAMSDGSSDGGGPLTVTTAGPFEGLVVATLTQGLADGLGIPARDGVIVLSIENPRRARHFQPGDIIAEVNGAKIETLADFRAAVADERRSWKIVLDRRGGRVFLTWRG